MKRLFELFLCASLLISMTRLGSTSRSILDDEDVDLGDVYGREDDDQQQQIHHRQQNSFDSMIQDWDSGLYGKPVCTRIPANMSLCVNLNYERMKVPNLLGHDTVEEVKAIIF